MPRFPMIALTLVAMLAADARASTAIGPYTAKRTTACLSAHQVIANPLAKSQAVPPQFPAAAVVEFSFALVPARALDHGVVVFERDAATAKRVTAGWIKYSVAQAERVQGIDQTQALILILQAISEKGNAITVWDNTHVKTASRARVAGCLR